MGFPDHLALGDSRALEHLGGAVTYAPGVGSPVSVRGIFDALYVHVDPGVGHAGISSYGPAIFLKLADLPSPPDTATRLTINGTLYKAHEIQPDGIGGVLLHLHLA